MVDSIAVNSSYDRILLDASKVKTLIQRDREGLCHAEAREYLNVPRHQWQILVKEGYVKRLSQPTAGQTLKAKFSISELDRFLKEIPSSGSSASSIEKTYSIVDASKRANCKCKEIIDLLLRGELEQDVIDTKARGLMSVQVNPSEVRKKTALADHGGVRLREAVRILQVSSKVLRALLHIGAIPSRTAINSNNRGPQTVIDRSDLDSFKVRYVSLMNLLYGSERHPTRWTKKLLSEMGVQPAFDPEKVHATFYERIHLSM
jgi:hypothetical protein